MVSVLVTYLSESCLVKDVKEVDMTELVTLAKEAWQHVEKSWNLSQVCTSAKLRPRSSACRRKRIGDGSLMEDQSEFAC